MDQSKIFIAEEADKYFERNIGARSFVIDHLLSLFPPVAMAGFDVAEFGIGGGLNLMLLKHYAHCCHGYDGSPKSIANFKKFIEASPDRELFHAQQVNLCEPFATPIKYDLVLYGFFAYYVSDVELLEAKKNLLKALKPGGYVFVYDFLSRECGAFPDARNKKLNVFKRNLPFWLDHFGELDLIDFRLFDNDKVKEYRNKERHSSIDMTLPADDKKWDFGAVFRRRG
jgi:hypothetical protein